MTTRAKFQDYGPPEQNPLVPFSKAPGLVFRGFEPFWARFGPGRPGAWSSIHCPLPPTSYPARCTAVRCPA